jgi:hypothetical protein
MIRTTKKVLGFKRPVRESKKISDFKRPGVLHDVDEVLPDADTLRTAELVNTICFPAHRRVATLIHLHPIHNRTGFAPMSAIKSNEPDVSFRRGPAKFATGRIADQKPLPETMESPWEAGDRQAIERGENEGMLVVPE